MSNFLFIMMVFIALVLTNLYPINQAIQNSGYIFYTNAYDESAYLQYDFSIASQSILSRLPQYFVTFAHNAGLSGGWINLTFDIVTLTGCLILVKMILKQFGYSSKQANLSSFVINFLPLLFSGLNPVVNNIFNLNISSGWIYWITVPQAYFLPIYRSPEPQVSIIILLLGIYFSLRWKSFIPLCLCILFLYSFVKIPVLFITLAIYLKQKFNGLKSYLSILISFMFISSILGFYLNFFAIKNRDVSQVLVASHYPLISFTSSMCLLLYFTFYRSISNQLKYPALVICLAPLAAVNHQIISGWITAPNGFEQNFDVYCISTILSLIVIEKSIYSLIALAISFSMLCFSSNQVFSMNNQANQGLPIDEKLLTALKSDSANVAINDIDLAQRLSMVFPRQHFTALALGRTYSVFAEKSFKDYQCVKERIIKDPRLNSQFKNTFKQLDKAYTYEHEDFILLHLGRKKSFSVKRDPTQHSSNCSSSNLQYFIVDRDKVNVPYLASTPTLRVKNFSTDWKKTSSLADMVVNQMTASAMITATRSTYDFLLVSHSIKVQKQAKYLVQFDLKIKDGGAGVHVLGADQQTVLSTRNWCDSSGDIVFSKKQFLIDTQDNSEVSIAISNCSPQPKASIFGVKNLEMWKVEPN